MSSLPLEPADGTTAGANRRLDPIAWATLVLLFGYLLMSRSFAYMGVGSLYVGEISFVLLMLWGGFLLPRHWLRSLVRGGPLGGVGWWLFVSAGYGLVQTFRGLFLGHDTMITLQSYVFHTYPLFLLVGFWTGARYPGLLRKTIHALAWAHGIYGVLYIAVLSRLGLTESIESNSIAMFGQPFGAATVILGLLSFERNLFPFLVPLFLNAFVLLGIQVRAEWLGFGTAIVVWAALSKRLGRLMQFSALMLLLLVVGWFSDFSIPAPESRGGAISTKAFVARIVSAIDEDLASDYSRDARMYASTISWRTAWWRNIWAVVRARPTSLVFGKGYGYPIWDLHPEGLGEPIRTPHNVFMFCLAYTGCVGVVLFYGLQLTIMGLLWRRYRATGQAFGICYVVMILTWTLFDNYFESPFGAIPYYLLVGMALAGGDAGAVTTEEGEPDVASTGEATAS